MRWRSLGDKQKQSPGLTLCQEGCVRYPFEARGKPSPVRLLQCKDNHTNQHVSAAGRL